MNDKLIAQSDLFRGISPEEAAAMLHCLQAVERRYPKGALICRQGEAVPAAGLLLSGEVHIVQDDLWGNQSIFSRIGPGELFSEAYAAVPGAVSLVNAVAAQESSVLLLSVSRILHTCPSACAFHAQLIRNLLACVAQKNLRLAQKITHTAPKTIRGRVLSYLSAGWIDRIPEERVFPENARVAKKAAPAATRRDHCALRSSTEGADGDCHNPQPFTKIRQSSVRLRGQLLCQRSLLVKTYQKAPFGKGVAAEKPLTGDCRTPQPFAEIRQSSVACSRFYFSSSSGGSGRTCTARRVTRRFWSFFTVMVRFL